MSARKSKPNFMQQARSEDMVKAKVEVFDEQFRRATGELALHAKIVTKDKDTERRFRAIEACHTLSMEIRDICNRVIQTGKQVEQSTTTNF